MVPPATFAGIAGGGEGSEEGETPRGTREERAVERPTKAGARARRGAGDRADARRARDALLRDEAVGWGTTTRAGAANDAGDGTGSS
jgi:hypothetical protein